MSSTICNMLLYGWLNENISSHSRVVSNIKVNNFKALILRHATCKFAFLQRLSKRNQGKTSEQGDGKRQIQETEIIEVLYILMDNKD